MSERTASKPTTDVLLSLVDQRISYGNKVVLDELNLHLHADECIVLLGKSGAGKSTLLKHLLEKLTKQTESPAWIPQSLGLVDKLSSFHNVLMGRLDQESVFSNLRNLIWPANKHREAIHALLEELSLSSELFSPVGNLSGGQQQRIAIARACYRDSPLLLADEPVTGLDHIQAKKVLAKLKQQFNSSVIALHDVDLALSIADRVIGIRDGRIVLDDFAKSISDATLVELYQDFSEEKDPLYS